MYHHNFTIELAKGTKYAYMSRILIPLKNPAIQKIIKNHDKILDIHMSMMQKFSGILELK